MEVRKSHYARRRFTVERLFHTLSDPTCRAILEKLSHGPSSVSHLAAPFNITLTAVVQHLRALENSRRVHTEKLGRVRTCQLETAGFLIL